MQSSQEYLRQWGDFPMEQLDRWEELTAKNPEISEQEKQRSSGELKEFRAFVAIQKRRADTLRQIQAATGLQMDVASMEESTNVAAFVTTDNFQAHIVESTLDSPAVAMHAAYHEKEHTLNRITELDAKKILPPKDLEYLSQKAALPNLAETDLMEGFNDLSTKLKNPNPQETGYSDKEVPAAEKLEELAQAQLNISLLEIFRSGNKAKLERAIRDLVDALQVADIRKELGLPTAEKTPGMTSQNSPSIATANRFIAANQTQLQAA